MQDEEAGGTAVATVLVHGAKLTRGGAAHATRRRPDQHGYRPVREPGGGQS
jgi:hypothetical protein